MKSALTSSPVIRVAPARDGTSIKMHEFLTRNRIALIERCRIKVGQRSATRATPEQIQHGIPLFLEQLIRTLRIEQGDHPTDSRAISGPADGGAALSEVGTAAAEHGRELLALGFTVDQIVHDYGDLCQAVTDLAYETGEPLAVDEFRTLNRCLDNAIAEAVTEFSYQRDAVVALRQAAQLNERLGFFVHELRNHLSTATLAFTAAEVGGLGLSGATGAVLRRSLTALGALVARSVDDVRLTSGLTPQPELFQVSEFIDEVVAALSLDAQKQGYRLVVSAPDRQLALRADRPLLFGALANLLQNAFKFSHGHGDIYLDVYAMGERIMMDVKDRCGGLIPGTQERMFSSFTQHGRDRSGLGLGLSIARESIEQDGGDLSVRNIAGTGCVFTVSMPRHAIAERASSRSAA